MTMVWPPKTTYWIRFHLFSGESYLSDVYFEDRETTVQYADVEMNLVASALVLDANDSLELLIVCYEIIEETPMTVQ